jgi:nitrate/nitrite transporter NarK
MNGHMATAAPAQTAVDLERRTFTRATLRILPVLMFAFLFAFIDRVNVGFAKLQMSADLGFFRDRVRTGRRQASKAKGRVLKLLLNPWIAMLCLIYFSVNLAVYGMGFWLPTLIRNMGVQNVVTIGWLSALPSLCTIIALPTLGRSADRFRERRWHLFTLFMTAATGLVLSVIYRHDVVIGIAALCLGNMSTITVPSMFWSVPTAMLGGLAAATNIALINVAGNLSGFFGPSIIGYVKDAIGSTDNAIFFLAAMMIAGAILIQCLPSRFVSNLDGR